MKNNNGFFAIEALTAFSIFLTVLLTLTPILVQLKTDQEILSNRRHIQSQLQGKLLEYLYSPPENYEVTDHKTTGKPNVSFKFSEENNLVKGCAEWKNAKSRPERFCLYGKSG